MGQQIRDPGGIVEVGRATGHGFDVGGIGQDQLKWPIAQDIPDWPPGALASSF